MSDTKNTPNFVKEVQKTLKLTHNEIIDKRLEKLEYIEDMRTQLGSVMNVIDKLRFREEKNELTADFEYVSEMVHKHELTEINNKVTKLYKQVEEYIERSYRSLRESLVELTKFNKDSKCGEPILKISYDQSLLLLTGEKANDYKAILGALGGGKIPDYLRHEGNSYRRWHISVDNLEELIEHLEYLGLKKGVDFTIDETKHKPYQAP